MPFVVEIFVNKTPKSEKAFWDYDDAENYISNYFADYCEKSGDEPTPFVEPRANGVNIEFGEFPNHIAIRVSEKGI